jgi:acetoacetyl-CoA synthetase
MNPNLRSRPVRSQPGLHRRATTHAPPNHDTAGTNLDVVVLERYGHIAITFNVATGEQGHSRLRRSRSSTLRSKHAGPTRDHEFAPGPRSGSHESRRREAGTLWLYRHNVPWEAWAFGRVTLGGQPPKVTRTKPTASVRSLTQTPTLSRMTAPKRNALLRGPDPMNHDKPLWTPSPDRIERSQMKAFIDRVDSTYTVTDWTSLWQWSVEQPAAFWREMLDFAEIRYDGSAETVFTWPTGRDLTADDWTTSQWFPDVRLNYATQALRFDDDRVAIHFESESGTNRDITYHELRGLVQAFATGLRRAGVRKGDRVAGFMPNMPEAVIAMLAAASMGAIWSSCSPDFGRGGVLDRFGQIEPVILLTADGYLYNGKRIDCLERVNQIADHLPSLKRVVIVPYANTSPDISAISSGVLWDDFLDGSDDDLTIENVPFDHPLFVMYSSGTTGVPKCIVHGHGGTVLQHSKELMLHCDLRRDDVIFYFTTCGWMMWNWLVSGLCVGATVVLYDGSPMYSQSDRLWAMTERAGITVFGTSPKYIAACQKQNHHPKADHGLEKLRCILSTGSPLSSEQFAWIYEQVGSDLQLSSISGGTDIISCFMLGNPILPVYAGEIQCRGLGMDVQAFDENNMPQIGRKGELVCRKPFPSRPIYFWNDPDRSKYRSSYFEHIDGVWRHGDFIEVTPRGGVIVYGRSDATLNPGGIRIGTAEIYRIVEAVDEVVDSIVVGKRSADDVEVCLFVVLREGVTLDSELIEKLQEAIASGATKRHVPRHIKQVSAIPHTISGKKVELAVTQMIHGETVRNRDALANPESLDEFRNIV